MKTKNNYIFISISLIYSVFYCFAIACLIPDFSYFLEQPLCNISTFNFILLFLGVLIFFVKNILVVLYAKKSARKASEKAIVIKTLLLRDYLSMVLSVAVALDYFIENLSFFELQGYIYPLLFLLYLIYISWGSHIAWYILTKRFPQSINKNFISQTLRNNNRKCVFIATAYTVHYVLIVSGIASLFNHWMIRSTRPYSINIIAFTSLNLIFLLVLLFGKFISKWHFLIMAIIDTALFMFTTIVAIILLDKQSASSFFLLTLVYSISTVIFTLVSFIMDKATKTSTI